MLNLGKVYCNARGNMLTCYSYGNALQISPSHDKLRENVR